MGQDPNGQVDLQLLQRKVDAKVGKLEEETFDPSTMSYSKLYTYASGGDKIYFWLGLVSAVLCGLGLPSFVFLIGDIIDAFNPNSSPEETLDTIKRLSMLFVYIGFGIWFFSYSYYAFLIIFSERVARKTRLVYIRHVLSQDGAWFDMNNFNEIPAKLNNEVLLIQKALGEKFGTIVFCFAILISGLAVGFIKGWNLALAIMAFAPLIAIGTHLTTEMFASASIKQQRAYGQSAGYAEQALNALKVVTCFGQQKKEEKNYMEFLKEARDIGLKNQFGNSIGTAVFISSILVLYTYALFIGSIFINQRLINPVTDKVFTSGDVLACFFGVIFGMFSLGMITPNLKAVAEGKAAAKAAFQILDRTPEIQPNTGASPKLQGKIEFRNVDFYYPSRPEQKILDNFSCTLEPGQTVAVVGASGSGKSTLVQLLERYYDPNQGEILIDGKNLKELHLNNYRQQVGYVSQEPILTNSTIRENMILGNPGATVSEIMDALEKSRAMEFIKKFDEGIDLQVGNQGGSLSGGQKQRIAIARAFIKRPQILLLDEATSALDRKNEQKVQKAIDTIKSELKNVTTLVIAHRLTTIRQADCILVMDKGKIVEQGDHSALLSQYPNGIYAKLVSQQDKSGVNEQVEADDEEEDVQIEQVKIKCKTSMDNSKPDEKPDTECDKKHEEADRQDQAMKDQNEPAKKLEFGEMLKRLQPYNRPSHLVMIGLACSLLQGFTLPVFGLAMPKCIFAMSNIDMGKMWDESMLWVGIMSLISVIAFFNTILYKYSFGTVSQGIILKMRENVYASLLTKHIGWHDTKDNAPGQLTTTLASDVPTLNGVSQEGIGVIVESFGAMMCGLIIGFIIEWHVSLVALAIFPLLTVSNVIQTQIQEGFQDVTDDGYKEANLLASDAIINYKVIQSFGQPNVICDQYDKYYRFAYTKAIFKAHKIGFMYGASQFISNVSFALLYYAGAEFKYHDNSIDSADIFVAIFTIFFATWGIGQANQFGPDMAKSQLAGKKIFSILDTKTEIDPYTTEKKASTDAFKGKIEFKDVWFRYPTRKTEWIFQGLNLTIQPNESIAIVGESGCGKSTFASLILRFYQPDFGTILIDDIDIKDYNVQELRQMLGFVMQEPVLFNYSVKENILYGNNNASNSDILKVSQVANAMEFLESNEIENAIDDNTSTLKELFEKNEEKLKKTLGEDRYKRQMKALEEQTKKDEKEGVFKSVENILDDRPQDLKDIELIRGFNMQCGLKGNKLSGGQKQRLAIARAVVRNPKILILDEATSALDESSQTKVQKALDVVMEGRTSIIIAHRLTTIEKCKRLAVIQNGKVVEEGNYHTLKNQAGGQFSKLAQGLNKQE